MATLRTHHAFPAAHRSVNADAVTRALLASGVLSAVLYPAADIVAGRGYPGYDFRSQAVSELFAIGAPTSGLVVPLFTLSSLLLASFAAGVWRVAGSSRALRVLAAALLVSALDAILLWNLFPMHMRGAQPTITDTMHLVFAANPFVLLGVIAAAVALPGRFRVWTVVTLVLIVAPAAFAFRYSGALMADQPTPWLGLSERMGQYSYQLWQATLAVVLMRRET